MKRSKYLSLLVMGSLVAGPVGCSTETQFQEQIAAFRGLKPV